MLTGKHHVTSPLRYPGGKGSLANFFKLLLLQNKLLDGDYVELYAGGAGVAWSLIFEEYVQRVHINDLNKQVVSFWKSVVNDTDALCKLIRDTPVTVDQWRQQKMIFSRPDSHSQLELGFSIFFLNRTNRSGIMNGGIIGGKEQAGKWKIDARYNKVDLIARINRIARYASRISIYNLDAADFIKNELKRLPKKSLIYLDPPYYLKGRNLYEDHYTEKDHAEIAKLFKKHIKLPWVISYDNVTEIKSLYKNYRAIEYNLNYSARERYFGSEIIFFSDNLIVPNTPNPLKPCLE